ncbi:MAG TPA: S8 family serine peptidase [candidate division Zixibacteria bacterium]
MMSRMHQGWVSVACAAVLLLLAADAGAGLLQPELEARLKTAAVEERLPIVIRVRGALPPGALKRQVDTRYPLRADRHKAAVETLRNIATVTQTPLVRELNTAYFDDRVSEVKTFWIDNIVTAAATPSAIAEIADRADVEEVMLYPETGLIQPLALETTQRDVAPADASGQINASPGLLAIRADQLWEMGITGKGRLVGSLDTGVDGDHFMLEDKWRGNNGYSAKESWFDPIYGSVTPRSFSGSGTTHGTQVMGIMVGVVPDLGPTLPEYTIGVCPDCQWMSAAAIDIPCPTTDLLFCGNLFESFQWLAEPDGNPNTEADVPHAIANPWGGVENPAFGCSNVFWSAVDNIEATGAAMVFAVGNWNPAVQYSDRAWNPANRITSDVNTMSVGMVDTRTDQENPPIHPQSSQGPSGCDNMTFKPEVVAPGVGVRSIKPNNIVEPIQAGTATGSSFATPHVAGAIALLAEINPNATVDELKRALYNSARDLGQDGEDNLYGRGIIDLLAAKDMLPPNTQPSLFIKRDDYVRPAPGAGADIVLTLCNVGAPASGVAVEIISQSPLVTVLSGTASFADMPNDGDSARNSDDPFQVSVDASVLSGERYPVRFEMTAGGGYQKTWPGAIQIGPAHTVEVFTHDAGNFELSVSAFGTFGLQPDALSPHGSEGVGFLYGGDPTQSLFEGAFLVGTNATHVSDNARDEATFPDVDFDVDAGGYFDIREPGQRYAEETRSAFTDRYAEMPIGLFIEQRTLVDDDPAADDYCIAEYTITNRSGATLNGLRAGLYFDWDFPWTGAVASRDGGGYVESEGLGYMRHRDETQFRGLAVISPSGTSSYRYLDNLTELFDLNGFTNAEKWSAMSGGFLQTEPPQEGDGSHLIAAGPFTLANNASVTVAFAIIGATSMEGMVASVQNARGVYNAGTFRVSPTVLQFTGTEGGADPASKSLTLINDTEKPIGYSVDMIPNFADVLPASGTVPAQGQASLEVTATVGDRLLGTYAGNIVINGADDPPSMFTVPTTLIVKSPVTAPVIPNPFNPKSEVVRMNFELDDATELKASLYDMGGAHVIDLDLPKSSYGPGAEFVEWDGHSDSDDIVADGVYICRVYSTGALSFSKIFKIAVKK